MSVAHKQPSNIGAEEICRGQVEFSAVGCLVPASLGGRFDVGVEQVCDVLEVSFSFCWTITEGNHLQERNHRRWVHENALSVHTVRLGVLKGEVHSGQAHAFAVSPLEPPRREKPWTRGQQVHLGTTRRGKLVLSRGVSVPACTGHESGQLVERERHDEIDIRGPAPAHFELKPSAVSATTWPRARASRPPLVGSWEVPSDGGLRYLITDANLPGACKRLHLYLRWMVRGPDDVDLGVWRSFVPASLLMIPLDTHIARVSRYIGLTKRTDLSWKTAAEITESLRIVDPEDPIRFDFSLCHHGMSGACPPVRKASACQVCQLRSVCGRARESLCV